MTTEPKNDFTEYGNCGIVIMPAWVNNKKIFRVYKEGHLRAEVVDESEAKRIAELLKHELKQTK